MQRRIIIIVICLLFISGCTNKEDDESIVSLNPIDLDELVNGLEIANNRLIKAEEEIKKLKDENAELKGTMENILKVQNQIDNENTVEEQYFDEEVLRIMDINIHRLYEDRNVDKYYYLDPWIMNDLNRINDFESMMRYYSMSLDGAYSEGYAYYVGNVYDKMGIVDFVDSLSQYDEAVIQNICSYLVNEVGYREGTEVLEEDLSNLSEDYDNNIVIKSIRFSIENLYN